MENFGNLERRNVYNIELLNFRKWNLYPQNKRFSCTAEKFEAEFCFIIALIGNLYVS